MRKGTGVAAGLFAVGILATIWLALRWHPSSTAHIEAAAAPRAPGTSNSTPLPQSKAPAPTADSRPSLPPRPSAAVASRGSRRRGFAWILPQLGASDALLDRLADGDLTALLTELKEKAASGDASSINILGWLAYQRCYLARSEEQISGYEELQRANAKSLPAEDAAWVGAVLKERGAYERKFAVACSQLVDQDQVWSWVSNNADRGDGASLWLLARKDVTEVEADRSLSAAAAAGFPQAQFELFWKMLHSREPPAGTRGKTPSIVELLSEAAERLPVAEANLAVCEYSGCDGMPPDLDAALTHARDAARKGEIDALLAIGPDLPTGQIGPDEVAAWRLVSIALQQNGCAVSDLNVEWMRSSTATLSDANVSPSARALAGQYWQEYGEDMIARLGCQ